MDTPVEMAGLAGPSLSRNRGVSGDLRLHVDEFQQVESSRWISSTSTARAERVDFTRDQAPPYFARVVDTVQVGVLDEKGIEARHPTCR